MSISPEIPDLEAPEITQLIHQPTGAVAVNHLLQVTPVGEVPAPVQLHTNETTSAEVTATPSGTTESISEPVHFSPARRLDIPDDGTAADTRGAPEEHIQAIRESVMATLEQMDIPIEDVLFSGYNAADESDSMEKKMRKTIDNINSEISRIREEIAVHPEKREQYQTRLDELTREREDPKPRYYFSGVQNLTNAAHINPIGYASVSGEPKLGIYSREELSRLGEIKPVEEHGDVYYVSTTPEELEAAKIATVHLDYQVRPDGERPDITDDEYSEDEETLT